MTPQTRRSRVWANSAILSLSRSSPDLPKSAAATETALPSIPGKASRACWNCNCNSPALHSWQSLLHLNGLAILPPQVIRSERHRSRVWGKPLFLSLPKSSPDQPKLQLQLQQPYSPSLAELPAPQWSARPTRPLPRLGTVKTPLEFSLCPRAARICQNCSYNCNRCYNCNRTALHS